MTYLFRSVAEMKIEGNLVICAKINVNIQMQQSQLKFYPKEIKKYR